MDPSNLLKALSENLVRIRYVDQTGGISIGGVTLVAEQCESQYDRQEQNHHKNSSNNDIFHDRL